MEFDHGNDNVFEACGVRKDQVLEAYDTLPNDLVFKSEIIELLVKAGDDPAKNLAVVLSYGLF